MRRKLRKTSGIMMLRLRPILEMVKLACDVVADRVGEGDEEEEDRDDGVMLEIDLEVVVIEVEMEMEMDEKVEEELD